MRAGYKLSPGLIEKMRVARLAKAPTLEQRFWSKVRKTPSCWIWTGAVCEGYGNILYLDRKCTTAHRVSLILAGIDVPADKVVDHLCRNKLCVRPDHLRVVTPKVNGTENNYSPMAINAQKTHCIRGHAFTPENTHMRFVAQRRNRHGNMRPGGWGRVCLACYLAKRPGGKLKSMAELAACASEERKHG